MLEVGSKIKYGSVSGEITNITDQVALVRLEDGKEYSVELASLVPVKNSATKKSNLKKMDFLASLAKEMYEAGIKELVIRNGEVTNFQADKSVDEIIEEKKEKAKKEYQEQLKRIEEEVKKENEGQNQETEE